MPAEKSLERCILRTVAALFAFAGLLAGAAYGGAAQDASIEELIAAARKHDPEAEYELGMRAYEGRGVPHNARQAYQLVERAAGRGHLEAQNTLGYFLQHGIGTSESRRVDGTRPPPRAANRMRK